MPDIFRQPTRLDCTGIDLVHPVDRMPPGAFPYLMNCRVIEEGRLESRPGYTSFIPSPITLKSLHSIRRLNGDSAYSYIVGDGTHLYAGLEAALADVDPGYSGNPLSLLTFRPDQSPESWMYVYDQNKLVKINSTGTIRSVGVAPPISAPSIEYGRPAFAGVWNGSSVAGWGFAGATTAVALGDRTGGAGLTINSILYNTGTTGWCCINPTAGAIDWAGAKMRITLNGGTENPLVREIHTAIPATTITGIQYDSGTTGACSLVLANSPANLDRNSLIRIAAAETVRVLQVILAPDGITYAVRCVTTGTRSVGDAVTGLISWYTYTIINHAAGEAITSGFVSATQGAAGLGAISVKVAFDSGTTNVNRPISLADDYLHMSVFLQSPLNVAFLYILVDIDPATAAGTPFQNNYIQWTVPLAQLGTFGVSASGVWIELVLPLSQGVRMGNDLTLDLTTTQALSVLLQSTGACNYGFDWWYNFGTYGATVQPNAPTGVFYEAAYRDSSTGAASVPGPANRYQLFPLRELVVVTPTATSQTGVNSIDIYRNGGTLTGFTYDGTVVNNFVTPNSYNDTLSDTAIQSNPAADTTLLQPWPVLGIAWSGVVSTNGTSVQWVSGSTFNTALLSSSIILINGVTYQTYGQPRSSTYLELTQSAGAQTNVPYLVASPTLAGQPLPYAFGPLEGPLSPVVFALGDAVNGGTLYYSNTSNADGASDQNTIELCAPSEPLISGAVWNGLAIVGSRDNIYLVRYAYLQTAQYQFSRIPSASGIWSRWACCRGPNGVYFLGRDGIYLANEAQAICITDEQLYPLFPHDGQAANVAGVNNIFPVDMSRLSALRLTCCDRDIYFDYVDILGNPLTLRYEIAKKRWFPHFYGNSGNGGVVTHYLVEPPAGAPNTMQILMLGRADGEIFVSGGNDDNGTDIPTSFITPSVDGGDERSQKLYVDTMTDADGTGTLNVTMQYDNNETAGVLSALACTGSRQQFLSTIDEQADLTLRRNVSMLAQWVGGPAGPRVYAYEPSGYLQPYLSKSIVTQFSNLNFQGWKHSRRLYPGIISTAPVTFTIWLDDGRKYGPYTIPSTGGRYRINPQMLDQNIKGLAFSYQVTSSSPFAFFWDSFTLETKQWVEPDYLQFAVFRA